MHNNAFYAGLLLELRQLDKQAANTPLQSNTAPKPAAAPNPAPKPAPATNALIPHTQTTANKPVYDFGRKLNAPQYHAASQLAENPTFRPLVDTAVNYIKQQPDVTNINVNELGGKVKTEAAKQMFGNVARGYSVGGFGGALSGIRQSWEDYKSLRDVQEVLTNSSKPDLLEIAAQVSATNPGVAGVMSEKIPEAIVSQVNKQPFGTLVGSAVGMGGSETPEQAELKKMLMHDKTLRSTGTNAAVNRVTNLSVDWLKNNWKTIAMVVGGGGALIYLLKNIMQSRNKEQNQQIAPALAAPRTGPEFL